MLSSRIGLTSPLPSTMVSPGEEDYLLMKRPYTFFFLNLYSIRTLSMTYFLWLVRVVDVHGYINRLFSLEHSTVLSF